MMGAAWIAGLINQPLKNLAFAAKRVRTGDFEASVLDETVSTHEIRAVNVGFNRMTQKLAKIEQDRAVMLAGISHDLRTPLARLRLEAELSVDNLEARENMVSDIVQLDAIIGKFLDYARPSQSPLAAVSLNDAVESAVAKLRKRSDIQFRVALGTACRCRRMVELRRIRVAICWKTPPVMAKSVESGVARSTSQRGRTKCCCAYATMAWVCRRSKSKTDHALLSGRNGTHRQQQHRTGPGHRGTNGVAHGCGSTT
ncbi:MAG: HAMP domain-containing protein [Comamonadaceae bacterium]|nr:HAMP domain-containing protein [Comamonadaceae bacterium]